MSHSSLSKSANQFAVDLFQCYLSRHGDKYKNLLLSPYLIYHSLAMMLVGAKGNTAKQLKQMLRMPSGEELASSEQSESSSKSHSQSFSKSPAPGNGLQTATPASARLSRIDMKTCRMRHTAQNPSSSSQASTVSPAASRSRKRVGKKSTAKSTKSNSNNNHKNSKTRQNSSKSLDRAPSPTRSRGRSSSTRLTVMNSEKSSRHLTPDGANERLHREFLWLTEQVLHGNHDFVHLASFIYLDKSAKRTERFKAILKDYYETKPKKTDFDKIELMCKTVNEDVARTTENIYHEILSKAEAQKLEKSYMLLVNAVFFRGFWLSNFTDVKKAPFMSLANSAPAPGAPANGKELVSHQVNMMSKLDYLAVQADSELDARIVRMPFEASDLQMLIILPNSRHSDAAYLCDKISAAKISQIIDELDLRTKNTSVKISMPIFCVDSGKISIQSTLVQLGAGDLFDKDKANLSGVCENKPVWLHKILHRCFIICDNRGAITSHNFEKARRRQMEYKSKNSSKMDAEQQPQCEQFIADHPFMYIIFDSDTKTILIMGLYTDPSQTLEVVHENQLSPEEAHQIYTEGVYQT